MNRYVVEGGGGGRVGVIVALDRRENWTLKRRDSTSGRKWWCVPVCWRKGNSKGGEDLSLFFSIFYYYYYFRWGGRIEEEAEATGCLSGEPLLFFSALFFEAFQVVHKSWRNPLFYSVHILSPICSHTQRHTEAVVHLLSIGFPTHTLKRAGRRRRRSL